MKLFKRSKKEGKGKRNWRFIILGAIVCYLFIAGINVGVEYTSSDEYCQSCHVHTETDAAWKLSTHFDNGSGVVVHCVECHLPPKGEGHLWAKIKHGSKDIYAMAFKDTDKINWQAKSDPEIAIDFTYMNSCQKCHSNLFPSTLSDDGGDAHLHYQNNLQTITCLNCHITVGHYDENNVHAHNTNFGVDVTEDKEIFTEATEVAGFESFTEKIPGTSVAFEMIAIPEGSFTLGSSADEPFTADNEIPKVKVNVSKFWMGKSEVSWDEFLAFFAETSSQGHASDAKHDATEELEGVDAITGPTAPWGAPDQGWGKGPRPAITMSHHAAQVYCEWLSLKTGKKYRLPTEAEWEYACRGGKETAYFFEGAPKDYTNQGFLKSIFGPKTEIIEEYAVYSQNSQLKTQEPAFVKENPFGLLNMSGNVWEFTADYYADDTYRQYGGEVTDPTGPEDGTEYVIRGGAFDSDAIELRSANRDQTQTEKWLVTDPQMPKSVWWYSDSKNVGFRVVCEVE
jgi:formylglycine-generating enzyme required for sulfatase activity/nitrate/TMAO reductase-like tetraheme cytochrome c subunit